MFKHLLVLLLTTTPLFADLLIDPAYRIGQLENGITYYLRHHDGEDSVMLRLAVPVGSVQEEEGEEGIAHWIEHIMFRGTRSFSRGDINKFSNANARTSMDSTVYELEANDVEQLVCAVQLMAEWVSCAQLRDSDIDGERQIVIEERRLGLCAGHRLSEWAFGEVLSGSKYAERMPIGLLETLENATHKTVRHFYEKWYTRVPVAIVVVGDIDLDAMETLIQETLGRLDQRIERSEIPTYPVPPFEGTRFLVRTDPEVASTTASLIFRQKPSTVITETDYRNQLVAVLAQAMLSERLTDCQVSRHEPVLPLELVCIHGDAREGVISEIVRLQRDGFTPGELERAVCNLTRFLTLAERASVRESSRTLAEEAVDHYLRADPLLAIGFEGAMARSILSSITLDEVNQQIRQLDLHNNNVVMLTVPEGDPSTPETVEAAYLAGAHAQLEPYVEPERLDRLLADPPTAGQIACCRTVIHFENGLTVHLLPNPHEERLVLFDGVALGGLSDFEPHQLPTARLVEPLLELSGIGHAYNTYTRSIYGGGSTDHLETIFQMIHHAFTQKSTTREEFERVRRRAIIDAKEALLSPEKRLRQQVRALNHSSHPHFVPSTVEQIELADYSLAGAIARKDFSNPAEFTFVFAGDFDLDLIKQLASTYLGSIPTQEELRDTGRLINAQFPAGIHRRALYCGREDKSVVQLTFPISLDSPTADQLEVTRAAAAIIGSRVHFFLRDGLDATYDVACRTQFITPDSTRGLLSIRFACDPQDAKVLAKMAVRELRLLKARGPTDNELTHLIRHRRERTANNLKDNAFLVHEVVRHTLHNWNLEGLAHIPERVNALGKPAVAAQISDMLPLDNYTCVILFPAVAQNSPVRYRVAPQGGDHGSNRKNHAADHQLVRLWRG